MGQDATGEEGIESLGLPVACVPADLDGRLLAGLETRHTSQSYIST